MRTTLQLADSGRTPGSYYRQPLTFSGDSLYSYYRHADVTLTLPVTNGLSFRMQDGVTDTLLSAGRITPAQQAEFENLVRSRIGTPELLRQYDHASVEEIRQLVLDARKAAYGTKVLEEARCAAMAHQTSMDGAVICQHEKKIALLHASEAVICALTDPSLLRIMAEDLQAALSKGCAVYVLVSAEAGDVLPTRDAIAPHLDSRICYLITDGKTVEGDSFLQCSVDHGSACMLVYGEEGLLQCRCLRIPAVVTAVPAGFYAQATVNQLGCIRPCVVYVPPHFDIVRFVPLSDRTRVSYWHLARLWEREGDAVYACPLEELPARYPQYFLNLYEGGAACAAAVPGWPMQAATDSAAAADDIREQTISAYLNSFTNISYHTAWFDESLTPHAAGPDREHAQPGILVHAVRIRRSQGAQVRRCPPGAALRSIFMDGETGVLSNFLFFMTPKLATLYNTLRSDRPREQADAASGHLDYMLVHRDGKRVETFPLFRKACIALRENGEFMFFNFRLGGGMINVSGVPLHWEADDVDASSRDVPVRVFTPYGTCSDRDADRNVYRKTVGEGRVNLVILQDRITCVRRGDVVLPSTGVVVSLTEKAAEPLLSMLQPLEDGYFDPSPLTLSIRLDAPQGIDPAEWEHVQWAYGGGLSLILNGRGLCDNGGDAMLQWMEDEGWMSPLSRQTQESALHTLVRHPRTAIGSAENGDLVILVYSGRTWRSIGADYNEMCRIAHYFFPDVRNLMNGDGGGSAVLGMVCNGSFIELSCPAASTESCVGMARPVNTVLLIPAERD